MRKSLLVWVFCGVASAAWADEGKWTPKQVLQLDAKKLRARGLKLAPSRLWDPKRGTGLLAGAVNVGGCSGAFVSPEGLVVTNHHCIFPMLQEHSTPARDLINEGFLARTRADELRGKGVRIQVPRRFTDVTAEVLAAVPRGADDLARFKAIDAKQKALVAECEAKPAARCQVASFSGGLEYTLIEALELEDVRLVYAPPLAVGEFGGEIDNWMWPRHTGDFGIVRAYSAENTPFPAEFYFPISSAGVQPGDFVMVLGYPGTTWRELLADEMAFRAERVFPSVVSVYGEMISILEGVTDAEGRIAVASQLKSLLNRRKNAAGQIEGLARGRIVEKQRTAEEAVVEYCRKKGGAVCSAAAEARAGLLKEFEGVAAGFEREFLLDLIQRSSRALYLAATLARFSTEREKPDLLRDPAFMEREVARLRDKIEREQKNIFVPADKALFAAWVRSAARERIAAIDRHFGSGADAGRKIDALYAGTKILSLDARMAAFGKTPAELRALKDPLLDLGFELAAELDRLKELNDRRSGAAARLRPVWRRAVLEHAGEPLAPDANGTLRVSFASVKGYAPRDGVFYVPQTTLSGMLAKRTDARPFLVPERLAAAAAAKDFGRWRDPRLGDVPVGFLADADTTGGNSGSPVVDGRGRLVGVNFDRVWENVANDFGFNPDVARNISSDVRYMLWLLERVEKADGLLKELGVGSR